MKTPAKIDHSPWTKGVGMALAWAVLGVTLALTLFAWSLTRRYAQSEAQSRFDFRVSEIRFAVEARMQAQEQVLLGARGLFNASSKVSRQEWRAYADSLNLPANFPGILGLGFTQYLRPEEVARHERAVRAEGFPDYSVTPPGKREEYTAIVYIEPFDRRNQRAFGYDMYSEPVRRVAMAAARDTGRARLTGKLILVQESGRSIQPGVMMFLPVYRNGTTPATLEERRQALLGYVYSPFRMVDLMHGILGISLPDVRLEIYDGAEPLPEELMYSSDPAFDPSAAAVDQIGKPGYQGSFSSSIGIEVGGRPWTLRVSSLPEFEQSISRKEQHLVLGAGTVISLLLFAVVLSLVTLRARAAALAEEMTAALSESREQFRAVSETANDPIITVEAGGRIAYFNAAAERTFGYAADEARGMQITALMPDRFRDAHAAGWDRFINGKHEEIRRYAAELIGRRRDGSEFPIEISIAGWSTPQGRFCTAILRDISERRRVESQVRELNERLRQQVDELAAVNRDLESFSYSVSHDLRAPLRAVDGFAGILEEEYAKTLDPEGQRLLAVIRQNSRRMGMLIDDLLTFARMGRTALNLKKIDMSALVREVVDEIRINGDIAGVRFEIAELPPARGDPSLLRQVWINLVSNAVKFSRTREAPCIDIGWEAGIGDDDRPEYIYFVRDNGVGFDMAHAGQLFGVFQRMHRAEDFPGTGVGLAIVHRIVTRHGGRIWAESQPDAGATFHFSLPKAEDDG